MRSEGLDGLVSPEGSVDLDVHGVDSAYIKFIPGSFT